MRHTGHSRFILSILLASLTAPAARAAVIHDETFTAGTWTVAVAGGTNVSQAAVAREPGAGVTGDAQRTTITGSGQYTFDVQHFKTDRRWTPLADGAITRIDWEVWYLVRNAGEFAGLQLAARQGGSTYAAPLTYTEPANFSAAWQRAHGTIDATDFNRFSGPGPADLDFSPSAAPIEFGYMLSRGVFQAGTTTYRASFYTLDLTATPVPEPAPALLLAAVPTAAWLLGGRRRSRHRS